MQRCELTRSRIFALETHLIAFSRTMRSSLSVPGSPLTRMTYQRDATARGELLDRRVLLVDNTLIRMDSMSLSRRIDARVFL